MNTKKQKGLINKITYACKLHNMTTTGRRLELDTIFIDLIFMDIPQLEKLIEDLKIQ